MSELHPFICTRSTKSIASPGRITSLEDIKRYCSNLVKAMQGGWLYAGDVKLRATSKAIPYHVLANGAILNIVDFPQLWEEYGTTFGGDGITTFGVPDLYGAPLEAAPTAPTQTVANGTVNTGGTTTTPSNPGQTGGTVGGSPVSGGRPQTLRENEEEV